MQNYHIMKHHYYVFNQMKQTFLRHICDAAQLAKDIKQKQKYYLSIYEHIG